MKKIKKYIRFYISLGNPGWMFTNRKEWNSHTYTLLFDADIWTMESIKNALDKILHSIRKDRDHSSCWFHEKGNCGAKYLNEFFLQYKGSIYTIENAYPWGCKKSLPNLKKKNVEIVDWVFNGQNINY